MLPFSVYRKSHSHLKPNKTVTQSWKEVTELALEASVNR